MSRKNPFIDWTPEKVEEHNKKVELGRATSGPVVTEPTPHTPPEPPTPQHVVFGKEEFKKKPHTIQPIKDELGLNKTERRFWEALKARGYDWIAIHPITLRLGDSLRFTPDFGAVDASGRFILWDTKGGYVREDAVVKIKTAARMYPMFDFFISQWKNNSWTEKKIEP